jgi:hypothetical protein
VNYITLAEIYLGRWKRDGLSSSFAFTSTRVRAMGLIPVVAALSRARQRQKLSGPDA